MTGHTAVILAGTGAGTEVHSRHLIITENSLISSHHVAEPVDLQQFAFKSDHGVEILHCVFTTFVLHTWLTE